MTNSERADLALTALQTDPDFRPSGNDLETTLLDMLANLMHLADREGLNFDHIAVMAENHYNAEIDEEFPDPDE